MRGLTRNSTKMRLRIVQTASVFLLLLLLGCLVWGSSDILQGDPGASVVEQQGKSAEEIQREIDEMTRKSMMTISLSPSPTLSGKRLRVNVVNDETNSLGQRFSLFQDGKRLYSSKTIKPGKTIEFCPADKVHAGEALVEIQAVDLKTNLDHGNPTQVKVSVCLA